VVHCQLKRGLGHGLLRSLRLWLPRNPGRVNKLSNRECGLGVFRVHLTNGGIVSLGTQYWEQCQTDCTAHQTQDETIAAWLQLGTRLAWLHWGIVWAYAFRRNCIRALSGKLGEGLWMIGGRSNNCVGAR
jgi:hypothetical protein